MKVVNHSQKGDGVLLIFGLLILTAITGWMIWFLTST